jgi:sigma-B regulation protein RsbU (phosphoserine phosphatase)
MFVSMVLARIKQNTVALASAGMPYPIVYRAATRTVEEIVLKGMPLGAFTNFPYQQKELQLSPGDVLILMSDGFPELFNDQLETLDSARVVDLIREIGDKSPQEIIDDLSRMGESWAGGKPQDDDMTFMVLKMKASNGN